MAIIGTFTKQENGSYTGTIDTLTFRVHATFEPQAKRGKSSPEFRIVSGLSDFGAAWERTANGGHQYLSVRLDDPSLAAPIDCRLVRSSIEDVYSLIWERKRD
jgi:uncharacterized protein (DUF736 family)